MRIQSAAYLFASIVFLCSMIPAQAEEAFLTCPHNAYCASLTVNGEFFSGDPRPGPDYFKRRHNVLESYPAQDRPGVRITAFHCAADEWCIAIDNKGGVYTGTARPTGDTFFRRR